MFTHPTESISRPSVLVFDDEAGPREALRMVLHRGYEVLTASTADEVRKLLAEREVDLVTFEFPRRREAGFELLAEVRGRFPSTEVLIVSGRAGMQDAVRALRLGVRDFLEKPFDVAEVHAAVRKALFNRVPCDSSSRSDEFALLSRLIDGVERHGGFERGHGLRVAVHAGALAGHLGLSHRACELARLAGMLHDLGKIALPSELLCRSTALDGSDHHLIAQHVLVGERLLTPFALDPRIASGVRHHHERWDGAGYPDRLSGDVIPLTARIVQLADAWDAMRSDRPYRSALDRADAVREIVRGAGSQFDPVLARVFVESLAADSDQPICDADVVAEVVASFHHLGFVSEPRPERMPEQGGAR